MRGEARRGEGPKTNGTFWQNWTLGLKRQQTKGKIIVRAKKLNPIFSVKITDFLLVEVFQFINKNLTFSYFMLR